MGEETKKEEPIVEEKKEEKTEDEKKEEEKTEDEKKEEKTEEEKPPQPFVLFVDLHCVGCAKKIEKSILRIRGVEGVVIEMVKNEVTIKGVVEPQAICDKIMKKTKRIAKILSPLPATEGEPVPELVASQVSGTNTVELNVNMHCEACALQLKKKILKMKGVRTVETELSSSKVTVTGTMDPNKLVDYVYRRTKKQAKIVPQPEPAPAPAPEPKPEEEMKDEPKPEEEKKEEAKSEEEKKEEPVTEKKDENAPGEEKKEEKGNEENKEEEGAKMEIISVYEENSMQRMMYNYHPLYHVFERMPPPQLFSDENPNACCIS